MSERLDYDLHESVGHLVARLFHALHLDFSRGLAEYDTTPPHWAVLISLHQGKAKTPSGLARYIGIDAAAITRVLDRLEAEKLVVRRPGPDRRSLTLKLTSAGRELTPKLAKVARVVSKKFLGGLSEAEIRRFKSTLRKMLANCGAEYVQE